MHPACELCKRACCEGFGIRLDADGVSGDSRLWWQLHGEQWPDGMTFIPSPCTRLKDGKCCAYESRPAICKDAAVGNSDCRVAVRRLRPRNWSSIYRLMEEP